MPPLKDANAASRAKKPQGLGDVPRFLRDLLGGFFGRLFYIFKLVWDTGHWILILMLAISLFTGIMPVVGALLSKDILNGLQDVIAGQTPAVFWGSAVMFLLIFYFIYRILNSLVSRLNSAVTRIAGEKVVRHVKVQIMQKAKEVDLASFDMPQFYEKLENANREAGMRPIHVLSATFDAVSSLITLVSYIIVLATAPDMWWTAPIMLLISLPTAIISFSYRRKNFNYMRRRSKDRRQMTYYSDLMVNKDMVKEIRMFGLGDTFVERYDSVFDRYYTGMRRLIVRENVWHLIAALISSVVNCVFFALIAMKVFAGRIRIGDYSLYTGALTSIASTVSALINVSATVYEGTLFIDNLLVFMKEKPTVVPIVEEPAHVRMGEPHTIEFVDVSFAYPGTTRRVLEHINLTLHADETIALVGLNGAGKTTFLKLLTRLYDPTEGKILLDGRDIREYDTNELYRMYGIIFQDFGKYAVSVSENISFGDVEQTPDAHRVREAAVQANAEEFIGKLPRGLETPLMRFFEPDGIELSIGQWQKLSIARAFYSTSDILILDEPTASLDPIAEQEIFNQFERLREGKTTIFVSHRLSSATTASKIIVLEYGKVVEMGSHRELMAKEGKYCELFRTQAGRYLEKDVPAQN